MDDIIPIQNKIYEIRAHKVMFDRDLAQLYGIETKVLKQSVRRNINRFPSDFMFQLTKDELDCLRSQFVTSNNRGGTRYMPFAFTEQGVAMLSSVLNSDTAIQINIGIMRAFVAIRQSLALQPSVDSRLSRLEQNLDDLRQELEEIFTDYNDINEDTRMQLELINTTLAEMQSERRLSMPRRNPVGFINSGE